MDGERTGAALARRTRVRLWGHALAANITGAGILVAFLAFLFPVELPGREYEQITARGLPFAALYLALAIPLGAIFLERKLRHITRWLRSGDPATPEMRDLVLTYPGRWALTSLGLWLVGAVLITGFLADARPLVLFAVAESSVAGGLTVSAMQYLVVEWIMRPVAAHALADGPPPTAPLISLGKRLKLTWVLVTGIPLSAIAILSIQDLLDPIFVSELVVIAALAIAGVGLFIGATAMWYTARAVVDPLRSIRDAMQLVERSDFSARVTVDDASEIGLLQAGFNRMAHGQAEREQLRQAFGTFVDPQLAERVLTEGTDLAGEDVEVSLLFLDIRGFTAFSEQSEAREVVAMLNKLFGLVVPVILRHGGHANKFIGDGLLAVFGAPERHDDHADRAVAAACDIAGLIRNHYRGDVTVGIGVNSGKVVVGTVGGGGRLDFTVIGDAVNTAARVEAATRHTGDDVLITDDTRALLSEGRDRWVERPSIPLKGKRAEVRLFAPVGAPA